MRLSSAIVAAFKPQEHDTPPPVNGGNKGPICEPFGHCERCPENELDQPFCQPFGNRQLLHCQDPETGGETPTWGPCGRIVLKETGDFVEFLACNIGFAVVGLLAVIARSKQLAIQRSRNLAARIGVSRSPA
ncbi:hypothetical protein M422DRAFT_781854 [Sphaerobolus stellatus SS14]|uniref:Uncharacterized protein n=1 Tax=Sphaerobolus stellatus (strain SS14) TaxID=990650 RepID=A0A0C9UR98_SPHS4|nr:hypothetical protein M422DRAFT_781854 [Sphaerobolus stellatus SS14]